MTDVYLATDNDYPGRETSRDLNLVTHRAEKSVWARRGWDGTRDDVLLTRMLVGVGGAALAIQGVRQGTWSGRMLAGVGGTLAWWALTGDCDVNRAQRWVTDVLERAPWHRDIVHEASAESFPASDAPSFTPTVGTGVRGTRAPA